MERSFFSRNKKRKRGFIITDVDDDERAESAGSVGREIELTLATMHLLAMFTWSAAFLGERDARTRAVASAVIIGWRARERVACDSAQAQEAREKAVNPVATLSFAVAFVNSNFLRTSWRSRHSLRSNNNNKLNNIRNRGSMRLMDR